MIQLFMVIQKYYDGFETKPVVRILGSIIVCIVLCTDPLYSTVSYDQKLSSVVHLAPMVLVN
jgi:hypothetical protein